MSQILNALRVGLGACLFSFFKDDKQAVGYVIGTKLN